MRRALTALLIAGVITVAGTQLVTAQCGFFLTCDKHVYLPTVRREASPTPPPTPTTPPPREVCRDVLPDGSFEARPSPWKELSHTSGRARFVGNERHAVHTGISMLELWPLDDEIASGISAPFQATWPNLSRAVLAYQWDVHTLDIVDNSDFFASAFITEDNSDVFIEGRGHFQDDVGVGWHMDSFDVSNAFRQGLPRLQLAFAASNDFSLSTWWHVDSASLNVCTMEPGQAERRESTGLPGGMNPAGLAEQWTRLRVYLRGLAAAPVK